MCPEDAAFVPGRQAGGCLPGTRRPEARLRRQPTKGDPGSGEGLPVTALLSALRAIAVSRSQPAAAAAGSSFPQCL